MFGEQAHNPDVLNCLANLSSDEVFTPPGVANDVLDLLPADLWTDPAVTFLDPVCKSGVFLREIARRLDKGLETAIPDKQARLDHIFTRQVYGLGITELTGRLARRSLYGTKRADGPYSLCTAFTTEAGRVRFVRTEHAWEHGRCAFCRANEESYDRDAVLETHAYEFIHTTAPEEIFDMRFDVVVGNPPYQLSDGGHGRSASPIYNLFVEQAKKLNPRFLAMIIPSRWFGGGKGLNDFREAMLEDDRVRSLDDFLSASEVFPNVGLKGGVCYFLWDRDHPGPCRVRTHFKDWRLPAATRPLMEEGLDIFVRFNEGISILRKVINVETGQDATLALPKDRRFDQMVSASKPFGLRTFFKGDAKQGPDNLPVYRNGGVGYVSRESLETGHDLIDCWKVYVGAAAPGTGNRDSYPHRMLSTPFIGEPGSICSETYVCIGPLQAKAEAESVLSYLSCRFTRLLILLHKSTQHTTRKVYRFVPTQDWGRPWRDEDLYEKYGLTAGEVAFVEKIVRPMGEDV